MLFRHWERDLSALENRYRLASQPGELALDCDENGLRLAGVSLLKVTVGGFAPRSPDEIAALLSEAYGANVSPTDVGRGLDVVAEALNRGDIGRAMVAAVRLRLPELSQHATVRIGRANDALQKYNPDEPRDWRGRWTTGDGAAPVSASASRQPATNPETSPVGGNVEAGAPTSSKPNRNTVTLNEPFRDSNNAQDNLLDPDAVRGEVSPDTLTSVDYMGHFYDVVLANYVAYLRSKGEIVQTEVRLRMSDGSAGARLDILAWDPHTGIIYGVEVKTGDSPPFTKGQFIVYPHLMLGGSVVAEDGKVMAMGLIPNVPLPPIPIYRYYQKDDKSDYEMEELNPKNMSRYFRQKK